tara:strand:- start:474 stop:665 length:192 start_codon:yes stop_codon:yes gene_type:complete
MIIATKKGMSDYTTQELYEYVEKVNAKYEAAPAFIKRTSFIHWKNNEVAICREIQTRVLGDVQ